MDSRNMEKEDKVSQNIELLLGLFLTIFAAMLAINDLGAGKYGDDEMIAHNKQTEAYNWYQSKSVKQSLVEGQRDMLKALLKADAIKEGNKLALDSFLMDADYHVKRYKMEKTEILKGSAKVGKENWIQDKDGEMGKIIGAEEWNETAGKLGLAGDVFDLASVFLELCLVMGAMGLVLKAVGLRKIFVVVMLVMGVVGTYFMFKAYTIAFAI